MIRRSSTTRASIRTWSSSTTSARTCRCPPAASRWPTRASPPERTRSPAANGRPTRRPPCIRASSSTANMRAPSSSRRRGIAATRRPRPIRRSSTRAIARRPIRRPRGAFSHAEVPAVCDDTTPTQQDYAKAYPTIRELELAHLLGQVNGANEGIISSLCPIHTYRSIRQRHDPLFGYRPAMDALVSRMTVAL